MKIVANKCFGGFALSDKALDMLGINAMDRDDYRYDYERTDESLVNVVETLGKEANGNYAKLEVVTIPNEATDWTINDYDGCETIYFVVDGNIYRA